MATTATGLEARDMALAKNSPQQLADHQRVTQGKVRTRFPPEPNGYLHVGHAKSMNMNFFEAFEKLGVAPDQRETYFRYDDTNPEAESNEYIDAIANNVHWLGYTPTKVTYSSQYFQELYDLALKLIRKGRAYVCHQSKAEIEASRIVLQQFHATPGAKDEKDVSEAGKSPFRSRSVAENLAEFEKMRLGLYGEETDASGRVTKVLGQMDWTNAAKPKGVLSWVPANSPKVEVRVYSHLFTVPELPSDVKDWESFVDSKNSERVYASARVDAESFAKNLGSIVQFERIGYFVLDQDSTKDKKVLNQIVALREGGGETASGAAGASGANASRKDAQMQQLALKLEKMKLSPADMFKKQPELYAQFDAEGLPTHSAAGEELTKNQRKKLKKEQDKQKKLHDAYLAKEKA
uniref:glutamine--tRNA ligase n=1 Tax=Phytophthora ramorum TaxID=164328 RepID=H3GDB7_PHYRM